jgi:dolichol-phosphate mannosyltransferase
VSLVLPVRNVEASIRQAVLEADAILSELASAYEVIVVDDGSQDATAVIVDALRTDHPCVRLVGHSRRLGDGASLRTGFEVARYPCVAFTDAEGRFNLNDLAWMVPLTDRAPVVVGYRTPRRDTWQRCLCSWCYNLLVRVILGTRVRDCDCALKVFRKEALAFLLPRATGLFINAEMLTRARLGGYDVIEVPVRHRPQQYGCPGVSLRDVPRVLVTMLLFWWREVVRGHRPTIHPPKSILSPMRRAG